MRSWPEWRKLVDYLVAGGYYDRQDSVAVGEEDDDSLLAGEDLTEEFVMAAQACLSFARDKPDLLRCCGGFIIKIYAFGIEIYEH